MEALNSRLIDRIEQAIDELDKHIVTVKRKEKSFKYDEEGKKPIEERLCETEEIKIKKGPVDLAALKQLVCAVKELEGQGAAADDEKEGIGIFLSDEAKELSG